MPVVASDSPTLISSLLRLSAHHLALAASALQPLKPGTLSLYLSVPVPVLTPSVVISRPTTASRPSTPLNPSPLVPQIRLCWPLCAFINYIYLHCITRYRWHSIGFAAEQAAVVWACAAKRRWRLGEEMHGVWSWGSKAKRKTKEDLERGCPRGLSSS